MNSARSGKATAKEAARVEMWGVMRELFGGQLDARTDRRGHRDNIAITCTDQVLTS